MLTALAPTLALCAAAAAPARPLPLVVPAHPAVLQGAAPAVPQFPPATEDLALAWPEDGAPPSMAELISRYGQITGQRMVMSEAARTQLRQARVPIDRPTTVPAAEVQGFFESLLFASDCVLAIDHASAPRLLRVFCLNSSERNMVRLSAAFAAPDSAALREHPAMLFTTVVDLPNLDVRQLSNSLRTMIVDANTMQLLPAGSSNSLVITGFGPMVADFVDHLRLIDAASEVPAVAVQHELVRLQNAVAAEVAPLVERALESADAQRRGAPSVPQQQGVPPGPAPAPIGVVADARLNALLLSGPAEALAEAKRVVALLDVK